jgi:hypothetical protein
MEESHGSLSQNALPAIPGLTGLRRTMPCTAIRPAMVTFIALHATAVLMLCILHVKPRIITSQINTREARSKPLEVAACAMTIREAQVQAVNLTVLTEEQTRVRQTPAMYAIQPFPIIRQTGPTVIPGKIQTDRDSRESRSLHRNFTKRYPPVGFQVNLFNDLPKPFGVFNELLGGKGAVAER